MQVLWLKTSKAIYQKKLIRQTLLILVCRISLLISNHKCHISLDQIKAYRSNHLTSSRESSSKYSPSNRYWSVINRKWTSIKLLFSKTTLRTFRWKIFRFQGTLTAVNNKIIKTIENKLYVPAIIIIFFNN